MPKPPTKPDAPAEPSTISSTEPLGPLTDLERQAAEFLIEHPAGYAIKVSEPTEAEQRSRVGPRVTLTAYLGLVAVLRLPDGRELVTPGYPDTFDYSPAHSNGND